MYTYICIHTYVYIHSVKDGKQSDSTFVSQHGSTYIHMYTHLHTPCILSRNQKTIRSSACKPTWKQLCQPTTSEICGPKVLSKKRLETHKFANLCVYKYVCVYIYTCICIYMYVCMYMCVYVYVYVYIYVCVCVTLVCI